MLQGKGNGGGGGRIDASLRQSERRKGKANFLSHFSKISIFDSLPDSENRLLIEWNMNMNRISKSDPVPFLSTTKTG